MTNVPDPSQPNGHAETHDNPDDLPLLSFTDMLFGGQLTSILVCQKCKHVSQTYEEFNDISLSIKAEDYFPHNRKRDRFKKIVGRLTGAEKSEKIRVNLPFARVPVEMQRSSSVPPSPRADGKPLGEEPPITDGPRRRSLDVHPAMGSTAESPDLLEETTALEAIPTTKVDPSCEIQEMDREDDKSNHSDVIVNVIGPEDKHVGFVDPTIPNRREGSGDSDKEKEAKEPEKEKEKSQDGWAKLSRRISMTVGIGRPRSDKESKKDRERKTRSMDRTGLPPAIKEDVVSDTGMQKSHSVHSALTGSTLHDLGATSNRVSLDSTIPSPRTTSTFISEPANGISSSSSSLSKPLKPLPPRLIATSSSTSTVGNTPHFQRPLITPTPSLAPSTSSTSIFPHVHRSKSPKPPKPSAAETEYLRKILADISTSPPSTNPFAIFKPPLKHSHSSYHPRASPTGDSPSSRPGTPGGGEKDKSPGAAVWLGMGMRSFSGIEECLRMFTAVEVLDGENMVGCRRCWKIQNGMLQTGSKSKDSDEYDEDEEDQPKRSGSPPATGQMVGVEEDCGRPPPIVEGEKRRRLSLKPISPTHLANPIPTSLSTPTVSFYTHPNSSDTRSVSSLPTAATSVKDSDGNNSSDDSPSPVYFSAAGSESGMRTDSEADENMDTRQRGPGGLPIPVISTTAPPDTPATSLSSLDVAEDQDSVLTSKSAVGTGFSTLNRHPRLTQALYEDNNLSSGSKDSLVIPHIGKPRPQRRKTYSDTTTDDNDISDDIDSDTSVGTSASADSVVELGSSPNGQDQTAIGPVSVSPVLTLRGSQQVPHPIAVPLSAAPPVQQKKPLKPPKPVIMRPAYKRYLIAVPPPVLVIHLKRFQQTTKTPLMSFSHGFKKLEDCISFPEYLDLTPFLAPRKEDYGLGKKKGSKDKESRKVKTKEERCMYRLYAVVVHIGNMVSSRPLSSIPISRFFRRSADLSMFLL